MDLPRFLIIFCAEYLFFLVFLILPFFWFKGRRLWVFKTVVALAIVFSIVGVTKHYLYTPRPFVGGNIIPLIKHESDGAFPSNHTALAVALAVSTFFINKKLGAIFFVLALIIGFARVLTGVHYGVDILGGTLVGLIVTPLVHRVDDYFIKKY